MEGGAVSGTAHPLCNTCAAACCRRLAVLLTYEDTRLLAKVPTGRRAVVDDPAVDGCSDREARYVARIGKKLAVHPFTGEGTPACMLLRASRCSVYEHRPAVRRDYEAGGAHCQRTRRGAGRLKGAVRVSADAPAVGAVVGARSSPAP